jgi:hypothetical protein
MTNARSRNRVGLEKLRRLQNLVNQIVYQTVELDSGAA